MRGVRDMIGRGQISSSFAHSALHPPPLLTASPQAVAAPSVMKPFFSVVCSPSLSAPQARRGTVLDRGALDGE